VVDSPFPPTSYATGPGRQYVVGSVAELHSYPLVYYLKAFAVDLSKIKVCRAELLRIKSWGHHFWSILPNWMQLPISRTNQIFTFCVRQLIFSLVRDHAADSCRTTKACF